MTNTATEASTSTSVAAPQREDVAQMLMDRVGDEHLGVRTRAQDWTWDEIVRESAARGALALSLRAPARSTSASCSRTPRSSCSGSAAPR